MKNNSQTKARREKPIDNVILKGLLAGRYENCFVTVNLLCSRAFGFPLSSICKISVKFLHFSRSCTYFHLVEREKLTPDFISLDKIRAECPRSIIWVTNDLLFISLCLFFLLSFFSGCFLWEQGGFNLSIPCS